MVFVKNWEDFETAAEGMYTRSPDSSRFSMKYAHHKGEIVLKLTDNNKVGNVSFENVPLLRKLNPMSFAVHPVQNRHHARPAEDREVHGTHDGIDGQDRLAIN